MPRVIDALVIHHSAGASGSAVVFRLEHKAKGWSDIGYHAVITNGHGGPDGELQPGRPEEKDGAGVFGNNLRKLHICLVGQFAKGEANCTGLPTPLQYRALGEWLRSRAATYGVTRAAQIVGHKEITIPGHGTACPGDIPLGKIREWFANARARALDEYLGGGAGKEPVPMVQVMVKGKPVACHARIEGGAVVGELADVCRALGHSVTWDGTIRALKVD
jgi:hypothetical protein